MNDPLTNDEKQVLLKLAREALEGCVRSGALPRLDLERLPARLRETGASFVTLTKDGQLRGCIGALEPSQPLAADVYEHAAAAALDDPRFEPVGPDELPKIEIEISRLTTPQDLDYADPLDLLQKLRPGLDGVVLRDRGRRATFLPQVWDKIPDKAAFLDQLCAKMGVTPDAWRTRHMQVQTYRVEEFHE
ncbi:MAG TPA: AmmeMemoRadiSam system protein A [Anaerolineales bacterium]|nr:AmmeMemoRadiSam system protein A [Anaerolineales bacterium]